MNETIYIVEIVRLCFVCCCFFLEKKKKGCLNKSMTYLMDCLGQLAHQKCFSNIHTEFLANDSKFLSLIKVSHHFKD